MSVDENHVREAARLVGLGLDPARVPAVLANLRRIAEMAVLVNAVELGPEDELGPEWKP